MSDQIQKNLRALDLNLLPILRELLYSQNVSHAAQRLHMTQPAVSEALGRLRIQFDDDILVRVGRKMVATPFAQSLKASLDDILGKVERLSTLQHNFSIYDVEQEIVIATGDSVVVAIGNRLIKHLEEHMPGVNVQLIDLQNFDLLKLKSGEIDMAIMPREFLEQDGICCLPLYREDFVIISRKDHPSMNSNVIDQTFKNIPKIGYKSHPNSQLRVPPPPGWHEQILITQMALLPYLVEKSDSIALIQRHVAKQFELCMNIQLHEIPNFSWTADVCVFWGSINEHSLIHKYLRQQLHYILDPAAGYEVISADL